MTIKYTESDAHSIFDYHERTGMLPDDMTSEEFDEVMAHYGIGKDDEDFTDPAGGHGLHSHI